MHQPLLAGDTTHEDHRGTRRIDSAAAEHIGAPIRLVLNWIDTVMDHVNPVRVDGRIVGEDVAPHVLGYRDYRIGGLKRGPLTEARQCVATAQLLGLPRPQRLEAVRRDHVGYAVEHLREVPRKVRVPGVTVYDVRPGDPCGHR